MKDDLNQYAEDILLGFPVKIEVGNRYFYIHPKTLGKTILLNRMRKQLSVNEDNVKINPLAEALRIAKEQHDIAIMMVAYLLAESKKDMYLHERIEDTVNFLDSNLSTEDLATLLCVALRDEDITSVEKFFKVDKDFEMRQKVAKAKKNDNIIQFGGRSIWGYLIGPAMEKWRMTFEDVVWKLSYSNLMMLLRDTIDVVCLTDDERKKCHISSDGDVINADDPKNWARIRAMKWD